MVNLIARRPLIVGVGGSGRLGSTTERALVLALDGAKEEGAEVLVFGGAYLSELPLFQPHLGDHPLAAELANAISRADGLIVASPSYHAGVSAMVKNALDHLEVLRDDPRPYLDGRPVGCVVTSDGCQAGGITLSALRSIVHAMRGWPTPLGATVNVTEHTPTSNDRQPRPDAVARHGAILRLVGRQVIEFALLSGTSQTITRTRARRKNIEDENPQRTLSG